MYRWPKLAATRIARRKPRPIEVSPRKLIALLAFALAMGFAQTGRSFTEVESDLALGESVRVGRITMLEQVDYDKSLAGV